MSITGALCMDNTRFVNPINYSAIVKRRRYSKTRRMLPCLYSLVRAGKVQDESYSVPTTRDVFIIVHHSRKISSREEKTPPIVGLISQFISNGATRLSTPRGALKSLLYKWKLTFLQLELWFFFSTSAAAAPPPPPRRQHLVQLQQEIVASQDF